MANERRACASFRSDAFPDFRFCRYYDYVDNNTLPIIERSFRSASSPPFWREALSDDDEFLRRVCDIWFAILRRSQQLIVVSVIIVAVTVCDLRTRILPIFPSSSFNGINNSRPRRSSINRSSKQMNTMRAIRNEDQGAKTRQAIIYNIYNHSRWTALISLGQFFYNLQKLNHVVVVVQCNQHHREMRHRGRTLFSIIPLVYKIIANNSYTYLLSVVDSKQHTVGIARIVHSKKILVECFIFAYLISLDLYS